LVADLVAEKNRHSQQRSDRFAIAPNLSDR
jgi:hypothetical protein